MTVLKYKRAIREVCQWCAILILIVFTAALLHDNSVQTQNIQASRLASCQAQNVRHASTVSVLKQIITTAEPQETKAQRQGTQEAYQSALLVINALQPEENCQVLISANH